MQHYVYQHRRNDTGRVFYVGKGCGARARCTQGRNPFWRAVVEKAGGYVAEFVARGVDEEFALFAEMELIDVLRRRGARLTNLTDGGEGMSGFKMAPESIARRVEKTRGKPNPNISAALCGVPKSEQHRQALSLARTGSRASEETRKRMSEALRGRAGPMKGRHHSPEVKAKIAAAVSGERAPFLGRKHSPESLQKMSAAHTGHKRSLDSRRKQSDSVKGERNHRHGKPVMPDRKEKQRATLLATLAASRVTCPHCGKECDKVNAARWHLDLCKRRAQWPQVA